MKKLDTIRFFLAATTVVCGLQTTLAQSCDQNPNKIICDDIENYSIGNISPQATWWIPWNLNDNSDVGAEVSTDFASQGTKSMKVRKDGAAGDDQLLKLGNKNAGRYSLKWKMYIPMGNAGYINIQTDENNPGASNANFSFQCYFNANGSTIMDIPAPTTLGIYPQGVWFQVEFIFDLDNNLAKLFWDGKLARAWAYPQTLGGIDFFAADNTYLFYVDEVEYASLPPIAYNVDFCNAAIDLTQYFGGAVNVAQTTGLFNNTNATVSPTDPEVTCWNEGYGPAVDTLNTTMWFTFTGDGLPYHIETVPCNATNYIGSVQGDLGDTQMAVYEGDDCSNLALIECNDDLFVDDNGIPTGSPDWRAGLDVATESAKNYYILIDGFQNLGVVAKGEFCIQIKRLPNVGCAETVMGTYTLSSDFVCFNSDVASITNLNAASFTVPNTGQIYGMGWAITSVKVDSGVWPPSLGPQFLGGTRFLPSPILISFPNNAALNVTFPITLYFTPILIANGTSAVPNPFMNSVDTTGACFFIGQSTPVTYLPQLSQLAGAYTTTPATNPPGNNGAIDLSVTGGYYYYLNDPSAFTYQWSGPNGFTSTAADLAGLAPGAYSVTVTDITGCASSIVINVSVTTPTKDPESVKSLVVSPNPTSGTLRLNLVLENAAEVRIEVINSLGQTIQYFNVGETNTLSQPIDLSGFANGTYLLRVTLDGEPAFRRIVLQR